MTVLRLSLGRIPGSGRRRPEEGVEEESGRFPQRIPGFVGTCFQTQYVGLAWIRLPASFFFELGTRPAAVRSAADSLFNWPLRSRC